MFYKLKSDSIEELYLPAYIQNTLIANGISTISQLIEQSKTNELYNKLCGFSEEDFDMIESHLLRIGSKLYGKYEYLIMDQGLSYISSWGSMILRDNVIYTIGQLIKLTKKELNKIPKISDVVCMEIIDNAHLLGLKFADECEEKIEIESKPLAILHLTLASLKLLNPNRNHEKNQIQSISDLIKCTTEELMKICKNNEKRYNEIIEKVHSLGLRFADERKEEKTSKQSDKKGPINDGISVSEPLDKPNEDKPQSQQFAADLEQAKKEIAKLTREVATLKKDNQGLREQIQAICEHLGIGEDDARKNK